TGKRHSGKQTNAGSHPKQHDSSMPFAGLAKYGPRTWPHCSERLLKPSSMPCPRCPGECRCGLGSAEPDQAVLVDPESYDPSEEQFSQSLVSARLPEALSSFQAAVAQPEAQAQEGWRREVAQRVTRYRTRRGYTDNALSFDFDATS